MKVKPNNKLKLRKVQAGQYLTDDNRYLIIKSDEGWSWQVTDGAQWVTKDKRKYKTKSWVERCVEAERYQEHDELQLWEG
jgi:hypothetical protein